MRRPLTFRGARRGFSLIEVISIAVIVGVASMIAVPGFTGWRATTANNACASSRENVMGCLAAYQYRTGALQSQPRTPFQTAGIPGSNERENSIPPSELAVTLRTGNYIPAIPTCPGAPARYYEVTVDSVHAGYRVSVACPMDGHGATVTVF